MFSKEHLDRLFEGAKAIAMDLHITRDDLKDLIYQTVDANGMSEASGVHIRLMVTRGLKPTPYQNPNTTLGLPTIVIIAEWKQAQPLARLGLSLYTVHVRRGRPDVQDPMWNSHSKLNCIHACIQSNMAGADEGLMLDPHGFVATCNSTNFFIVRKSSRCAWEVDKQDGPEPRQEQKERKEWEEWEVWTPTPKYQLHGITRANILGLCRSNGIVCYEKDFTLTEVYSAQEVSALETRKKKVREQRTN
jgi:branched-subunit amino acid aminotransferase/4-amino-4-deoxychorismate lyase